MAEGDVYRGADGSLVQMLSCDPLDNVIFYGPASHICRGGKVLATTYEEWIFGFEPVRSIPPAKYDIGQMVEYAGEDLARYVAWRYYFGDWTYVLMFPGVDNSEVYVPEREVSKWARRRITRE